MGKKVGSKKVAVIVQKSDEVYDAQTPNLGIGAQARACIIAGMNFQDTYALIKSRVPHTKFSKRCYYWYRSHLLMDGKIEPKVKAPKEAKKEEVKKEEVKKVEAKKTK